MKQSRLTSKNRYFNWHAIQLVLLMFCTDIKYHPWYWLTLSALLILAAHYCGLYYYLIVLPIVLLGAIYKTLYLKDTHRHRATNRLLRIRYRSKNQV